MEHNAFRATLRSRSYAALLSEIRWHRTYYFVLSSSYCKLQLYHRYYYMHRFLSFHYFPIFFINHQPTPYHAIIISSFSLTTHYYSSFYSPLNQPSSIIFSLVLFKLRKLATLINLVINIIELIFMFNNLYNLIS